MPIYAYTDETEFLLQNEGNESMVGNGILITKLPVDKIVIDEALENLKNDPEKEPGDLKTLAKGYFHASCDSKNAHSHLCNSINKHISGIFRYTYFKQSENRKISKEKATEELFQRTFKLNSLEFFSYNHKEIYLQIEDRKNFNIKVVGRFFENLFNNLDAHAYELSTFITYYPAINVTLTTKTNPGTQVVDFILWAMNRAQGIPPKDTWKNRLMFKYHSHFSEEGGPQNGGEYHLNIRPDFEGRLNYPTKRKLEIPSNQDLFLKSYLIIECSVILMGSIEVPHSLAHLKPRINAISEKLRNKQNEIDGHTIQEMARVFLRLFDSLPIYETLSDLEIQLWEKILESKKLAGLLLRIDLIQGNRSLGAISRWRNNIEVRQFISTLKFSSFRDIIDQSLLS